MYFLGRLNTHIQILMLKETLHKTAYDKAAREGTVGKSRAGGFVLQCLDIAGILTSALYPLEGYTVHIVNYDQYF